MTAPLAASGLALLALGASGVTSAGAAPVPTAAHLTVAHARMDPPGGPNSQSGAQSGPNDTTGPDNEAKTASPGGAGPTAESTGAPASDGPGGPNGQQGPNVQQGGSGPDTGGSAAEPGN
ncbi:MAG: hypothetical protein ACYCUG_04725 [Acidimicrobiales bacterium]